MTGLSFFLRSLELEVVSTGVIATGDDVFALEANDLHFSNFILFHFELLS